MDNLTPDQRALNMRHIRSVDTKPEKIIRKLLWHNGYRYRLYSKKLPGKPDIVFAGRKKVIFINGCFWHKHDCKYFQWPKTREAFWRKKIGDTVERDKRNHHDLIEMGWNYLVIWECEIKEKSPEELLNHLRTFLDGES